METSAKTGMNAQEIFVEAAKLLYKDFTKFKKIKAKKQGEELKANDKKEKKKKKCC
jgi:DNA-directed RNA polymerase alpha subunit